MEKHDEITINPPTFEAWRPKNGKKSVMVLMSGGVDSSVAALRLKEQGWDVCGFTMKIPVADQCRGRRPCCGAEAGLVCRDLGLPHYFVDVEREFERRVIKPFQQAYASGRTPSPCVLCNTALKFGEVWDVLEKEFGATHLATGHYARIVNHAGGSCLCRAADLSRDQSYFLYGLSLRRLPQVLFPLGENPKSETREQARTHGLDVADRGDSMELCFAGEGDYQKILPGSAKRGSGSILDPEGRVIGRHRGVENYTIGQRSGLEIKDPQPYYVLKIDADKNILVAGPRNMAEVSSVRAGNVNVLIPEKFKKDEAMYGKIRSAGPPVPCVIRKAEAVGMTVDFDPPVFAPTPGQHLVLYDGEGCVVAGGEIM